VPESLTIWTENPGAAASAYAGWSSLGSITFEPCVLSDTTPTEVTVMTGGVEYPAKLQGKDTYLATVPAGTDITALSLDIALPLGASIWPPVTEDITFDFSGDPPAFTITAADGTGKNIFVKVAFPYNPPVTPPDPPNVIPPDLPSWNTTPTQITVTFDGAKYPAELQSNGVYLITVPAGTDITALPLAIALPAGAFLSPPAGKPFDFSGGPLAFTVTTVSGVRRDIFIEVRVDAPLDTTPTEITVTVGGSKYPAELQNNGDYLITVPVGTDITALPLAIALPEGVSLSPPTDAPFDFSGGPLAFTLTAADGTTREFSVEIRVDVPAPKEQAGFTTLASDCEILYPQDPANGGTVAARLRLPFAPSLEPETLDAARAEITGLAVTNVSYEYGDGNGNFRPVTSVSANAATGMKTPYLQIAFTAPSLSALSEGKLEKITYRLKDDATEYVQTYEMPLTFSAMTFTEETEEPRKSGGCNAGFNIGFNVGLNAAALLMLLARGFPSLRGKRKA
jgi:hypothetical protein